MRDNRANDNQNISNQQQINNNADEFNEKPNPNAYTESISISDDNLNNSNTFNEKQAEQNMNSNKLGQFVISNRDQGRDAREIEVPPPHMKPQGPINAEDHIQVNENNVIKTTQVESEHEDGHEQASNLSTWEETVCQTLTRDLKRIIHKIKYVLIPSFSASKATELQNWDLWGPWIICLLWCITISWGEEGTSTDVTFIAIFAIIWCGGVIITFNAQFLGARIGICQSICLLGYCVFPILIAAFINRFLGNVPPYAKVISLAIAVIWSCFSSVGFMSTLTVPEKKFVVTFPVFLFFISLALFVLNS